MATVAQAIANARNEIESKGSIVKSTGKSHGTRQVLYAHSMTVTDFDKDRYPYWSKEEDNWYQNIFVRKETNLPPEELPAKEGYLYPYVYAHRSRYHDDGYGYLAAVIKLMGQLNADFSTKEGFLQFLQEAARKLHIETILGVLKWQGPMIEYYLDNKFLLRKQLSAHRKDTLQLTIDELKSGMESSRAVTQNFVYDSIDKWGVLGSGGVPPYQNYQLFVDGDGIVSVHLHRSLDVMGGVQLDLNHDIDWGLIASNELALPLKKVIIVASHLHRYIDGAHLDSKTNIKDWLAKVTYGYNVNTVNVDELLERYEKKIDFAFARVSG